jgi:hypothetical protein
MYHPVFRLQAGERVMRKILAFVVAVVGGVVGSLLRYRIGGFVGAIAGLCVGYSVCFGMVRLTSAIMRDVRDIPLLWGPVLLFFAAIIFALLFFLRAI